MSRLQHFYSTRRMALVIAIGIAVALAGGVILLGWWRDIHLLTLMGQIAPNTGGGFVLAGGALALRAAARGRVHWQALAASLLAGVLVVLELLILSQYSFGINIGIDALVVPAGVGITPPRSSPNTALHMLLLGLALLVVVDAAPLLVMAAQVCAITVLINVPRVLLGRLYSVAAFTPEAPGTTMSPPIAVLFIVMVAGVLLLYNNSRGLLALLFSKRVSGATLRRLLPFAVLLPLLTEWLVMWDRERSILGAGAEIGVLTSVALLLFGWNILLLDQVDQARLQSEATLQQRTTLYETILDSSNAVVYVRDLEERYIFVNHQFEQMFNLQRSQVIGQPNSVLFPPELVATWETNDQAMIGSDTVQEYEEIAQLPDGIHHYRSIKFPLRDASGRIYAICGMSSDITEQKKLEAQLLQAQKMETIGQFAGGIAHDFNNLLTAITGYAELALEDLPAQSPVRNDLIGIEQATKRAAALTRQLLTFARRQPLDVQTINLNDLINNLDKLLRRVISEDITLTLRLEAVLQLVRVDTTQFEQVLVNLVLNARDALPSGGQITIETTNVVFDPLYARAHLDVEQGAYVMLSVSDNGIGMSAEVQERIFEPFFTTKEVGKGTGLGLATCYGIVKQHGGTIWVYSEVGRGTAVKVYLPQTHEPADEPMPAGGEPVLAQGSETVLVVEDEPSVRELIVRVLRGQGYSVLEAVDGVDALRVAEAFAPATLHLLLTDMVMPKRGGLETAKGVRVLYPALVVVYMSGYTEHTLYQNQQLLPHEYLLTKPFALNTLAQTVRAALEQARALGA